MYWYFLECGNTCVTIYIFKDANFGNTPCWGYEEDCHVKNQFSKPHCIHHSKPWSVHLKIFHLEIKMIKCTAKNLKLWLCTCKWHECWVYFFVLAQSISNLENEHYWNHLGRCLYEVSQPGYKPGWPALSGWCSSCLVSLKLL